MKSYPRLPRGNILGGKHEKYINTLSKIAADIVNPVSGNTRLAACVVYRNDIVSFGINEKKSHPFQAKYGKNSEAVFLHAETSAIKNALKYLTPKDLESCSLYVCRVKYSDQNRTNLIFGMSMPCEGCFRCINTFNIPKVIYTLDNGNISML